MQDYKKINVWRAAHELTVRVYKITMQFPKSEVYALTSQLRRAVASIPSNIAEGCGRNSQADFAHFLNMSLGSANESSYFLLLAKDLSYIHEDEYHFLENEIERIKAMLISLISKVRVIKN
ncbi:MAG: four helix bundle protein [Dysgonamonadaceae bacterium]|jgi:four helix bundle protein|nr:four helix bundle protein [Dysgonamonadaceae bacterium]